MLIYVDTIHNMNSPRLKLIVMHFVAVSPNSTAATTAATTAAAITIPPTSQPMCTLVEQSSQTSFETLDMFTETHHKVKLKM